MKFIGFHSNKNLNFEVSSAYYKQFKIDYPIIFDQSLIYADRFKALKTPHVFVLNRDGEVLFQGGATNSRNPRRAKKFYLKQALDDLSQSKEVQQKVAKTLGCYIQR